MSVNKVTSKTTETRRDNSPKEGNTNIIKASPTQMLAIKTKLSLLIGLYFADIESFSPHSNPKRSIN